MAQKFLKLLRTHCESILYEIHEHKMKLRTILMSLIKTNDRVVKHSYVKLKKWKIKRRVAQ